MSSLAVIGPYTFATMSGRLQAASAPTIPTLRGLKPGSRRPVVQPLTTTEEQPDLITAWIQALKYRLAIGAITNVTDDGGVQCPVALICDVRCSVRAAVGAVSLVTTWSVMPHLTYGDAGQATFTTVVDASNQLTLDQPAPVATSSTAILVGGITFTTATGDLQWPITEAQITAVSNGARAIGGAGASARPDTGSGKLDCAVEVADEAAGFAVMNAIRAMVGTFIDVSFGGVTIPGVAVRDAGAEWDETKILPGTATRLVQASISFDTQDTSGSGGPAAEVQVAEKWGNWKTVPRAWVEDDGEGLGGSVGHVTWLQDVGRVQRAGQTRADDPTDYGAQWVRVRARTSADGQASGSGTTLTPVWWGEVLRDRIVGGSGQSATRTVTCGGLIGAMAKCWPLRWYEQAQDGTSMSDPGEVLPFNRVPGGDGGGIGGGPLNTYTIHDRYRTARDNVSGVVAPAPVPWTAHQLVDAWLAAFRHQYPQGPQPTLTGQVAALDYISAWDLTLRDFGAGVIEVVAVRWGLALRVEVDDDDVVTLRVSTGVATDTTIPGLGTLPANDRAATVDLTGTDVVSYDLVRAYEQQVDHLVIRGGHPWYCFSYRFGTGSAHSTQLAKGWTADEESAWNSASPTARDSAALQHVWRRWILAEDYVGGHAFNNTTNVLFNMNYATATSDLLGTDGYSGEFSLGVDAPGGKVLQPRVRTVRFTRDLPIWTQKDWAAITGSETVYTPTTPGRQHEGPILFGITAADVYSFMTDRWQVQVEDDAPAILLGHNAAHGAEIKGYLAGGNYLMVTIGVRYPLPWTMSWRRKQDERPRDQERCLVLPYPHLTYRQIVIGTVLGLEDPVNLKQAQQHIRLDWETTVNSGISKLSPLLALAKLRYQDPSRSLTYTRRGVIDVSTETAPGSLVSDATIPLDGNRTWTETINLVRTGRSHHFVGGEIATSYTCDQLLPSRDKALLAPPVPLRVLGKQLPYLLGRG